MKSFRWRAGFTLLEVLVALLVISVGALAVMRFASQTGDMAAETSHLETMSRLASEQLRELARDGYSSSLSREGDFKDHSGYVWAARSRLVREGGWYVLGVTVTRRDTKRSVTVERLFREKM
jgi:prepilin-type N-terminal cleavage/methylation domain-containing protein